ncbi:ferric reductase like transmembrane component-domain-containing protein [Aspergillus californicus]
MHDSDEPTGGLPWLDSPVMLHSSREDMCMLTPELCVYRRGHWRYWYQADNVYALNTVYFLCATVGVFAIAHFAARYAPRSLRENAMWRKGTAAGRLLAYRGVRVPGLGYWSGSLGVAMLILAGVVFFFAMTLGPRPYYWPNTDTVSFGGSPPIATRAGWMALALLPFILVLGTKANLISALTGVPHEKLQVFHHWTSYAMFVLALIHTFPFIVYDISQGDMMNQWKTSMFYWTGVAALLPQTWLTVMSFSVIRNRYYEFFKSSHFIIALLFLLFLFFHCDFRLSSWDYSIAGASLYLASLFTSLIRTHLINGRHTASLSLTSPSTGPTLLKITIPTILNWTPGQHVFIRFASPSWNLLRGLGLHTLTSHPFTISSTAYNIHEKKRANEMVFYVKPKNGITGRLASLASLNPGAGYTVLLEGPYGGVEMGVLERFESVLIISGGSGGGFSLPVFESALRLHKERGMSNEDSVREIRVIFASPSVEVAEWYRAEIEELMAEYNLNEKDSSEISISIHVTSTANTNRSTKLPPICSDPKTAEAGAEEDAIGSLSPATTTSPRTSNFNKENYPSAGMNTSAHTFSAGRPDLPTIISTSIHTSQARTTAIFACGPSSMLHDIRNAAAVEQERILKSGSGSSSGEVYLHTESFEW